MLSWLSEFLQTLFKSFGWQCKLDFSDVSRLTSAISSLLCNLAGTRSLFASSILQRKKRSLIYI